MAGQNTFFPMKVLKCLENEYPEKLHEFKMRTFFNYGRFSGFSSSVMQQLKPKLHTIREDKSHSWVPGREIHFVINNRTKDRYQFGPKLEVTGTQNIEVRHTGQNFGPIVIIDGTKLLGIHSLLRLAHNDGFDSIEDFFSWFSEDFKGKIIHWTNLKY
jgi:hypothetical protein